MAVVFEGVAMGVEVREGVSKATSRDYRMVTLGIALGGTGMAAVQLETPADEVTARQIVQGEEVVVEVARVSEYRGVLQGTFVRLRNVAPAPAAVPGSSGASK